MPAMRSPQLYKRRQKQTQKGKTMIDPTQIDSVHLTAVINGQRHQFALKLNPVIVRDLMQSVELSDEPFSLMLASPSLYGGRGNAITERANKLEDRRAFAESIAKQIVNSLMKVFGSNDKRDGYSTRQDQNG